MAPGELERHQPLAGRVRAVFVCSAKQIDDARGSTERPGPKERVR